LAVWQEERIRLPATTKPMNFKNAFMWGKTNSELR
jgi:hypothetical protein